MSKRDRERREQARRALLAIRQAEARRRRLQLAGGSVGLVLVIFAALVVVKLGSGGTPQTAPEVSGAAAAAVVTAVTNVRPEVLDQVATGDVVEVPSPIQGQAVLTDQGKPLVLYVGAEYCPFCAAERWPVVVALSRFGTFSGLGVTASAADDVYPNTPTLSFFGSSYESEYLSFQGVETASNVREGGTYRPLQALTDQQQRIFGTFNAPPYVRSAGSVPFIDYANQAVNVGASFSPDLLAGHSAEEIAAAIGDPTSDIGRAVGGAANSVTALLCRLTGGQPAQVCTSPGVRSFEGRFDGIPSA